MYVLCGMNLLTYIICTVAHRNVESDCKSIALHDQMIAGTAVSASHSSCVRMYVCAMYVRVRV